MFYFLQAEKFRKPSSFQKFSRVQKWNIGSIWVKANIFLNFFFTKYMLQWYQQTKQFTIIKNLKDTNTFSH